jgi:alkanesulfonate monooxygenase SsuD/methylene tetrahydromethanopterin reductase-like flavin-dependent oxidoreductase (luciferase family)
MRFGIVTDQNQPWPTLVERWRLFEQLGFDSIWDCDHFIQPSRPTGPYYEAWTLLAGLAACTQRIRVGVLVSCNTFRHPALLAKMAAAVQELCGGRFILGLGAGNQSHEHNAFGLDFEHRIGRFKEYLPLLNQLLAGQTVSYEGRYYTLREASLRTAMPPVPIWVAAGGPQMFELAARHASCWNIAGGGTDPQQVRAKFAGFADACRQAGREARDFEVCKMTFMAVAADAASARTMVDELATRSNTSPAALAARLVVGTPDEIAARLRALTEAGVNHHIFNVSESEQWPNYWEAAELAAREVIPRVRD